MFHVKQSTPEHALIAAKRYGQAVGYALGAGGEGHIKRADLKTGQSLCSS